MWAHFLFLFQTAPMPQFDGIEEQITEADSIVTTGHLESIDDVTAAALLDDKTATSSSSAPDWHWIADVVAAGLPDGTSSSPLVRRRSTSFTTTTFSPFTCAPPPSYLLPDGSPDWDLFNRLVEEGHLMSPVLPSLLLLVLHSLLSQANFPLLQCLLLLFLLLLRKFLLL